MKKYIYILVVTLFVGSSNPLMAASLIEQIDGLEIDWGSLRVRYSGESQPKEGEDYEKAEKKAWVVGLMMAQKNASSIYKQKMESLELPLISKEDAAKKAGMAVSKNTYSVRTEYFSDGKVKVHLETLLSNIMQHEGVQFTNQSPETMDNASFSGLVLRSTGKIVPSANYKVVDETGRVIFKIEDVAADAYKENLMGRWLQNPTRSELTRVVGVKPLSLPVSPDENGRLVVQGSAWQEVLGSAKAVLQNAKIVIIVP